MKPNFLDHWAAGIKWPVKTKKGSMVTVTMGYRGLWCDCKYFDIWSRCPHAEKIARKF
jgi:hypothetical protein